MTEDTRTARTAAPRDAQTITVVHGSDGPEAVVLALYAEGHLGYLAMSCEWSNDEEPLIDELQDAADQLVRSGLLPEFEEWFA